MSHRIEILENNTVEVFAEGSDVPHLRQPSWPNGTAWSSAEEARSWAEMFVEAIEVADAPHAPAGPGLDREPKITDEQFAALNARPEMTAEQRAHYESLRNPSPPTV